MPARAISVAIGFRLRVEKLARLASVHCATPILTFAYEPRTLSNRSTGQADEPIALDQPVILREIDVPPERYVSAVANLFLRSEDGLTLIASR